MAPTNIYEEDLAYIHHEGFGTFARETGRELLRVLGRAGISSGRVVDLGCGSGIWAGMLSDFGYEVWGVDISSAMIEMARRNAPEAVFHVGSLWELSLPECVAVTCLGECLNYCLDSERSRGTVRDLFERIYRSLGPGGLFICDLAEPGRGFGPPLRHFQGDDWAVLVDMSEDREARILTRDITIFRRDGDRFRRHRETHRLLLMKGREVAELLRETGFKVRLVRGFGGYRFPKSCVGVLARKPSIKVGSAPSC